MCHPRACGSEPKGERRWPRCHRAPRGPPPPWASTDDRDPGQVFQVKRVVSPGGGRQVGELSPLRSNSLLTGIRAPCGRLSPGAEPLPKQPPIQRPDSEPATTSSPPRCRERASRGPWRRRALRGEGAAAGSADCATGPHRFTAEGQERRCGAFSVASPRRFERGVRTQRVPDGVRQAYPIDRSGPPRGYTVCTPLARLRGRDRSVRRTELLTRAP